MALTHLDAGVVIGLLDASDVHHESASQALAEVVRSGSPVAMAASAFAACLVGPARRGERAMLTVDELFRRLPIEVVHLDADISRRAALFRAKHTTLCLPDALVIAAAASCSAERLITTDRRWPTARKLGLTTIITVL